MNHPAYNTYDDDHDDTYQVPGGVGPMTIAMLLRNTVNGCRRSAIVSLPPPPTA